MKFVQVTDIHLTREGNDVLGKDPSANFQACLNHIMEHHADADMCIITGDLSHWAEAGAYELLKRILTDFPMKTRLLIGNHDDRSLFQSVFTNAPRDENGFVQWSEQTAAGKFIYLDTVEPKTHAGHYCADRQEWLKKQLSEAENSDCYLFMHHNPTPVGLPSTDEIGLVQTQEFKNILSDHKNQIKHIFHGHCHLPMSGTVAGIPFCSLRGTNHHSWQDFSNSPTLKGAELTPAYNVVLIQNGDCIIHTIDYSYNGPIAEFGTKFEDWDKEA